MHPHSFHFSSTVSIAPQIENVALLFPDGLWTGTGSLTCENKKVKSPAGKEGEDGIRPTRRLEKLLDNGTIGEGSAQNGHEMSKTAWLIKETS
jgi:hypothetical protein